jgi:hypothetical protein
MAIDLLTIPGVYVRPGEQSTPLKIPGISRQLATPAISPQKVRLHRNGDADWQYPSGTWSSSGHWKIVKGFYLSIVEINPDPAAQARHESSTEHYYRLCAVEENCLRLDDVLKKRSEVWNRVAGSGD